jgi:hypothetical protein
MYDVTAVKSNLLKEMKFFKKNGKEIKQNACANKIVHLHTLSYRFNIFFICSVAINLFELPKCRHSYKCNVSDFISFNK